MIQIITDSTADLGSELAEQFAIHVVPLYVNIAGQTYHDGENMTIQDLFRSVQQTGQLPKTSAPGVADFLQAFSAQEECIYIGISNKLSATIQNAFLARETCGADRVFIIDSLNLSTGIGLLALRAAELRDQGLTASEIYTRVSELVLRVRTSFIIETLDFLYKGGRCSAMQNLVSSLLQIRPVIGVRPDGTLGVKAKTRGTRQKGLQTMLDDFRANLGSIDHHRIFVTHTGCDVDAEYLKQELAKMAPIENILITTAGTVVASHCGPDTIGILYLLRS
jgi:DegV family protein with EDD domain